MGDYFSTQSLAQGDAPIQTDFLVSRGEVKGSWHGRGQAAALNREEEGGLITTKEYSPYFYCIHQKKGIKVYERFLAQLSVHFYV